MKKILLAVALVFTFAAPVVAQRRGYYGGYGAYPIFVRGYGCGFGAFGATGFGVTGVKFNLNLLKKEERETVKNAIVTVDGAEVGIVNEHDGFWNGVLQLPPGPHEVLVQLEDSREFSTTVVVRLCQVTRIYIRFPGATKHSK